jgi:FMN phosphatase YigB (HAD superfamily)
MIAFYFDVAGVLIPDKFAPDHAPDIFRELGRTYQFDPENAHAIYTRLQPSLDLGRVSLAGLCSELGIKQEGFERDWMALHPVDGEVIALIERFLANRYSVGLATNFCRRLLDLLIASTPVLSRLSICCSSDIGLVKPSFDFFRRAAQIMGAQETVFIDDRLVNVDAARGFGWTAVHASHGWLRRLEQLYFPKQRSPR